MNALTLLAPPPDSAAEWAERIAFSYQHCVESFIETGRLLMAAKAALPHGEFTPMIENELPFGERTAQRLMAIAEHPWLSNPTHASLLPADWTAVYELVKLTPEQLDQAQAAGKIHPKMERKEAINGARAIAHNRQEPDDSLNYFPTGPWATRALMEVVLPHLGVRNLSTAWEPACGEGHIAEVLKEYTPHVLASDIHDYGYPAVIADFLQDTDHGLEAGMTDWIITNPPFGAATIPFIQQALRLARTGVAMLVRSQWIAEGNERYDEIFRDTPPTLIAFFVERCPIHMGRWEPDGKTFTAYCWLVWVKDMPPQPPFWIPPGQRERLTKEDDAVRFTTHPVTAVARGATIAAPFNSGPVVPFPEQMSGAGFNYKPAIPLPREDWERATKATIAEGEKMIRNFWSDQK